MPCKDRLWVFKTQTNALKIGALVRRKPQWKYSVSFWKTDQHYMLSIWTCRPRVAVKIDTSRTLPTRGKTGCLVTNSSDNCALGVATECMVRSSSSPGLRALQRPSSQRTPLHDRRHRIHSPTAVGGRFRPDLHASALNPEPPPP
jgi:hypothetical protein